MGTLPCKLAIIYVKIKLPAYKNQQLVQQLLGCRILEFPKRLFRIRQSEKKFRAGNICKGSSLPEIGREQSGKRRLKLAECLQQT